MPTQCALFNNDIQVRDNCTSTHHSTTVRWKPIVWHFYRKSIANLCFGWNNRKKIDNSDHKYDLHNAIIEINEIRTQSSAITHNKLQSSRLAIETMQSINHLWLKCLSFNFSMCHWATIDKSAEKRQCAEASEWETEREKNKKLQKRELNRYNFGDIMLSPPLGSCFSLSVCLCSSHRWSSARPSSMNN